MNKEDCIFIRVEADTKKILRNIAEDKGLNVSTYCRTVLLEKIKENKNDKNDS